MHDVAYFIPNIKPQNEVLLFHECECIEHYPFHKSEYIGLCFADVCHLMDVSLPLDCQYAFFRRRGYTTAVKEVGSYQYIINSKIRLKPYEQNPSS